MNYRWLSVALGVCLLIMGALISRMAHSQGATPEHISAWNHPDALDSVNAAPENHWLIYEDDRIRLLEVIILPQEKESLHGHKYPSVFAFDAVQPAVHDHMPDGNVVDRKRGSVAREFPVCSSRGPEEPHAAENVDTFPQHFYRLEFKKIYGSDIQNVHWHRVGKTISRDE